MSSARPAFPLPGPGVLAARIARLCALPDETALTVARGLLAPGTGRSPEALAALRGFCPEPDALLRLVCLFEAPATAAAQPGGPLLAHLAGGWRRGEAPAPWFDPTGYEVLSAARRDPQEAAILHYAREGWARGLDPDPRQIRGGLTAGASLVLAVQDGAEAGPALALIRRGLAGKVAGQGPEGAECLVLDASPGHVVAHMLTRLPEGMAALRAGLLRLVLADAGTDASELGRILQAEAAGPILLRPLPRPDHPPVPVPAPPRAAALHLTGRRQRLRQGEIAPRLTIRCPAPDPARAHRWGDYHFAGSLAVALRAEGVTVRVALAEDWEMPEDPAPDATLLLRGVRRCRPRPGPVNLMWMLSHPDRVEAPELLRYDHVFVASLPHAAALKPLMGARVSALLQCSDPDRFAPDTQTGTARQAEASLPAHPLLFVGNSRRADRWIVSAALATGHPPAIYGAEWEDTPAEPFVQAQSLPNASLGAYYRRARIVLNDHWPDMAARGFVSNRLFDIAMAGGFPLSDGFEGAGMFFGQLPQVRDAAELDRAIRHFTARPAERAARAAALHALVRHRHTFAARARRITARLRELF